LQKLIFLQAFYYIIKQDVSLASQRFNKSTENKDVSFFKSIFIILYNKFVHAKIKKLILLLYCDIIL